MPDKDSYWAGKESGKRTYDGSPYDYGAIKKQEELAQQQRREQKQQNDNNKKVWDDLGKPFEHPYSNNSQSSGGSISLKGVLVVVAIIAGCIWYFTDKFSSSVNYATSYTTSKLDEISDPPASPGFVNIAEHILIYPKNKKESAIGQFRYGITEDSIKWFLASVKIEKAPVRMSLGNKKMVYLKNIPSHWVTMTNGQKPVSKGWFMVFMFHNFIQVDQESYARIKAANF